MKIKKAALKEGIVTIHLEERNSNEDTKTVEKAEVKSTHFDVVHPDFRAAFDGLVNFVRAILELPMSWGENHMTVTGVTFSYGEEEDELAVSILCEVDLAIASNPFCFATPMIPVTSIVNGFSWHTDITFSMAIKEVIREAEAFMDGKRAQLDLFKDT